MSAIPVADDVLGADVAVLSLTEVGTTLGLSMNKVRQLLREGQLIAIRRDGELYVPADFFMEGNLGKDGLVKGLAGTVTVLSDAGYGRTEMLRWLFEADETLPGTTPINALRTNHGTEVKRRAQAMAF
ncbi:hypothetical protein SAMN05216266_109148 [Amycolatopsis marina]|uniref:Uncharacterized protein n=1 Tax=Amycolatopsis marina TaxID=490629 RepID=A0A1I1AGX1_9PSEU|nr:Rv2175c family DNA-binding protein [Amycolatopsis marina]SFB37265.1 hypothetical protein SAMN05216266_109148 [Amycolatopsis marina]